MVCRKLASLFLLLSGLVSAQVVVFQVTASQGDGSTCTGTKNPTTNVNFVFTCVAPFQGQPTGSYHIFEGGSLAPHVALPDLVQLGDVLCLFAHNPTNFAVTMGTLPPTPPYSLSYSCSTTVRTSGVPTGNVAGPSGVVTWSGLGKRSFSHRLFHLHS